VQQLCLPFLRIAALLRHHLYNQALPHITTEQSEFVRLVYYLELVTEGMDWHRFNAAVALNWPTPGNETGRAWCGGLVAFINHKEISAHNLLIDQHLTWHRPRLLRLPYLYDKIFQVSVFFARLWLKPLRNEVFVLFLHAENSRYIYVCRRRIVRFLSSFLLLKIS
jgi:hypothetical protein